MATIVGKRSNVGPDPVRAAIASALAGQSLASVRDSLSASRYAVSNVGPGGVPALVGAQIGPGTQGVRAAQVTSVFGRTGAVAAASGDYNSGQVTEGTNLYFTASRVLVTVLAGLSTATSAVITAADTVLSALGKLQAQISANVAALAGKLTASNNLSDLSNASTARTNLGLANTATVAHSETVIAEPFFTGDGTTNSAPLEIDSYPLAGTPTVTAMHQTDWQGRLALSNQSRVEIISNNTFAGAAPGATLPSGWTVAISDAGLTLSVIGSGTEGGMPYLELRLFGTAQGTQFALQAGAPYSAWKPQWWTMTASVRLTAGSAPSGGFSMSPVDAGNGYVSNYLTFVPIAVYSRYQTKLFVASGVPNTPLMIGRFSVAYAIGESVDVQFRIAAPQIEDVDGDSVFIATSSGPRTVTDYAVDASGNVTFGQAPANGATADWDGSGTARYPANFAGPVTAGSYTVATLPTTANVGSTVFASDGRTASQGVGAGTGVPVFWTGTAWFTFYGNAQVQA